MIDQQTPGNDEDLFFQRMLGGKTFTVLPETYKTLLSKVFGGIVNECFLQKEAEELCMQSMVYLYKGIVIASFYRFEFW
jgi:hypothetical protein